MHVINNSDRTEKVSGSFKIIEKIMREELRMADAKYGVYEV